MIAKIRESEPDKCCKPQLARKYRLHLRMRAFEKDSGKKHRNRQKKDRPTDVRVSIVLPKGGTPLYSLQRSSQFIKYLPSNQPWLNSRRIVVYRLIWRKIIGSRFTDTRTKFPKNTRSEMSYVDFFFNYENN